MSRKTRLIVITTLIAIGTMISLAAYDVYPYLMARHQLERDVKEGKLRFMDDRGVFSTKFYDCRAWRDKKLYDEEMWLLTGTDRRSNWIAPEFSAERMAERTCLLRLAPYVQTPFDASAFAFWIRQWLIHFPDKSLEAAALKALSNARANLESHREVYDRQTEVMDIAQRSFLIRELRDIYHNVFWTDALHSQYNALQEPIDWLRDAEFGVREPEAFQDLLAWKKHMLDRASRTKSDAANAAGTH